MFASQLLRIWEAIPNESKYETSLHHQDMIVEENRKITLNTSEVQHQLDGPKKDDPPIAFEVKDIDKSPSPKFVDNFSLDDEYGTDDSQDVNGILHADSLPPGATAKNTEVHDKNVLEIESRDVVACCKELNHVMKDISIDEGTHVHEQDLIEKLKDARPPADTKFVGADRCDDFVGKRLPVQEYGTRSFLRSFIDSLDDEGNEVAQRSDKQCSSEKTELGKTKGIKANILRYDSKVEGGTITFNFSTNGRNKNVEDEISNTRQPQCICHENSDTTQPQCSCNDNSSTNKIHRLSPNIVSSTMNKCGVVMCDENSCKDDVCRSSMSDSLIIQGEYDFGEASFSTASLVPVPFSGSVSLRSDTSTTSTRSFAFPILQPEWNTSPVRMVPGDERHFRKHKFWRSSFLCCRCISDKA